ncbi:hypothetical protein ACFUMH_07995 [Cellulomonas sp. NPDC057328]|uniref:hypothetical protein n=1 Tax=Cellulomonas sp. NPDC057328 TaxID=3346101 RepID=UPI00362FA229
MEQTPGSPPPGPGRTVADRARRRRHRLGGALVSAGLIVVALVLLQPWASCPDDSASAACPVPAEHVPLHTAALLAAAGGIVVGGRLVLVPAPSRGDEPGTPREHRRDDPGS